MVAKHRPQIFHDFKRVNLTFYRKFFMKKVQDLLPDARRLIRYKMPDSELTEHLVARELVGIILQGNGFFAPMNNNAESMSRYYRRSFRVYKGKRYVSESVEIRVSDHQDQHVSGKHRRITINFLGVGDSNDALHLCAKRAMRIVFAGY